MTLDEAIQRENKIAKENQKIVDTQIVFDDVSISELYCDDTEIIEEHLDNYKKCAEYHEQIAEWLEELKILKSLKNCSFMTIGKTVEQFEQEIRNKAIYDFADKMIIMMPGHKQDILQIAEQLKVGREDESK